MAMLDINYYHNHYHYYYSIARYQMFDFRE